MTRKVHLIWSIAYLFFLYSCGNSSKPETSIKTDTIMVEPTKKLIVDQEDWTKNAVIYEVNIRQYTPEGTFDAFASHLPRLKELGVDVLWLMPIFPVGEKNRKGDLGSYYSVKDFKAINPNMGDEASFKNLINQAHEMGFKIILDWVANHTAWDHVWVSEHIDWYTADSLKNRPVVAIDHTGKPTDWTDVANLDYLVPEMRTAMIEALNYWIVNYDIDGYRCDVAGFVPLDFWISARKELEANKQIFMLAEWEDASYLTAFDLLYAWDSYHLLNKIALGKATKEALIVAAKKYQTFETDSTIFPWSTINEQMNFLTNHDENSWNGSIAERMGAAHEALAVYTFTIPGYPLIYSGQEAGLNKRLAFFSKDEIDWSELKHQAFYADLSALRHQNPALWSGSHRGVFDIITTDNPAILAYERSKGANKVLVVLNLSPKEQNGILDLTGKSGTYASIFENMEVNLGENYEVRLGAWQYKVFGTVPLQ